MSGWCGAGWACSPRRVKTARERHLRSSQRWGACACRGLDRRGRMDDPAAHAGGGMAQELRPRSPLTNNTVSLAYRCYREAFAIYQCLPLQPAADAQGGRRPQPKCCTDL